MDDDLHSLEAELQQLRPAAPSRALVARVGRDLAPAAARERPRGRLVWLWALPLPAAAALALAFVHFAPRPETPAPAPAPAMADTLKPVTAQNILYSATDEGIVTLGDGTAARRERLRYVDTIVWKNPRTNASLTWTVPREEVRFVPVAFQ